MTQRLDESKYLWLAMLGFLGSTEADRVIEVQDDIHNKIGRYAVDFVIARKTLVSYLYFLLLLNKKGPIHS